MVSLLFWHFATGCFLFFRLTTTQIWERMYKWGGVKTFGASFGHGCQCDRDGAAKVINGLVIPLNTAEDNTNACICQGLIYYPAGQQ